MEEDCYMYAVEVFLAGLNVVTDLQTHEGSAKVGNYELLSALFSLEDSGNQQPSYLARATEASGSTSSGTQMQEELAGSMPPSTATALGGACEFGQITPCVSFWCVLVEFGQGQ